MDGGIWVVLWRATRLVSYWVSLNGILCAYGTRFIVCNPIHIQTKFGKVCTQEISLDSPPHQQCSCFIVVYRTCLDANFSAF